MHTLRTHAAGEAAVHDARVRAQAGVERGDAAGADAAGLQMRACAVRHQHALLAAPAHSAPAASASPQQAAAHSK